MTTLEVFKARDAWHWQMVESTNGYRFCYSQPSKGYRTRFGALFAAWRFRRIARCATMPGEDE